MKIFLCWSGERSKRLARALKEWLTRAVPGVRKSDIFFSENIPKGSDWFKEVRGSLAQADAAVICLTPENVHAPWMHFEAGAVLGHVGNVFPYFLGVRATDLQGPFGEFQVTVNTEEDTRRLAEELCKLTGRKLPSKYEEHWSKLKHRMEALKVESVSDVIPRFAELFQRKTFDEPLNECTHQTWCDRYVGARETQKALAESKALVGRVCEPHQKELFNRLVATVDGYAGLLKGFLLEERRFSYAAGGEVDFTRTLEGRLHEGGAAISAAAERRMKQIKRLVYLLDSPAAAAVLAKSVAYSRLTVYAERKEVVHAWENAIRGGEQLLTKEQRALCEKSIWEFDRIAYYLILEHTGQSHTERTAAEILADSVRDEIERLRAREDSPSEMPLHYALRAFEKVSKGYDKRGEVVKEVEEFIKEDEDKNKDKKDKRKPIKKTITKLRQTDAAA